MFENWVNNGKNMILEFDRFWVSYNPSTGNELTVIIASIFGTDMGDGREETAIMFHDGDLQLILNGDHRAALEAIGNDPEGVIQYYRDHPESHSEFTVDSNEVL